MLQSVPNSERFRAAVRLDEPTARGLAYAVARAGHEGRLHDGELLPPIRAVAQALAVSPTTVSSAWAMLVRAGTITTDGRRGSRLRLGEPAPERYRRAVDRGTRFELDLSTGVPDPSLLPDLTAALRAVSGAFTAGSYLDDPVLPELEALLRTDWPYRADALTVVDGAMDAVELVTRAALGFGDRVVVEDPCFPPLLDLLEAAHVEVVGVPLDEEGLVAGELAHALERPVAAIFIQPRAQNPTGASMTRSRAKQLAGLIAATDAVVVEDDSAAAIASTALVSIGSWLPAQTVHIRSFSKSHGPDLRLAAMSGPAALLDRVAGIRQLGQSWTSRILQRLLVVLLHDDDATRTIAAARASYATRRRDMQSALATHGVAVGGADGFNLWIPVADEVTAVRHCASRGIGVAPGSPFRVEAGGPDHIRITVSALADDPAATADDIAVAARGVSRTRV
jgi:DNA-binding transcriptional MocR family regulator